MALTLKKNSSFTKTYVQINMVIEEQENVKAIQYILEGFQNIILVLSIFSLIVLYAFEFMDYLYCYFLPSLIAAWENFGFQAWLGLTLTRLVSDEGLSWLKQEFYVS